jgi:thiamine biosynthesis protein ThiS
MVVASGPASAYLREKRLHRNPDPPCENSPMMLHINGQEQQVQDGMTLAGLLESLKMKADRVAVELNREIVPRDRWAQTNLQPGDRLEIVHFVGGGGPQAKKSFAASDYC